jgi:hypothetical protein
MVVAIAGISLVVGGIGIAVELRESRPVTDE